MSAKQAPRTALRRLSFYTIVIVFISIIIAFIKFSYLSFVYDNKAAYHSKMETLCDGIAGVEVVNHETGEFRYIKVPPKPQLADYHHKMLLKYQSASMRPWQPISPDPPPPKTDY